MEMAGIQIIRKHFLLINKLDFSLNYCAWGSQLDFIECKILSKIDDLFNSYLVFKIFLRLIRFWIGFY